MGPTYTRRASRQGAALDSTVLARRLFGVAESKNIAIDTAREQTSHAHVVSWRGTLFVLHPSSSSSRSLSLSSSSSYGSTSSCSSSRASSPPNARSFFGQ
eukprot:6328153-Pyramimonas_sp.AAC.1